MDDGLDSISMYLTEDCKQSYHRSEETLVEIFTFQGRWTTAAKGLYCLFWLKEFCKQMNQDRRASSFTDSRRAHSSFDRRFVQFLETEVLKQKLTEEQKRGFIKRTKSRYNTMKRNYNTRARKKEARLYGTPDLEDMVSEEAGELCKSEENIGLKQQLAMYQVLRGERRERDKDQESPKSEETQSSRRYKQINTRSETSKQTQSGTTQI